MRGKVRCIPKQRRTTGITPAYAGKSAPTLPLVASARDHPRVCGEKRANPVYFGRLPGSPPRMRGKDGRQRPAPVHPGITPAYAGKSFLALSLGLRRRDHPRVCGEKNKAQPLQQQKQGSPPRMRGKAAPTASIPLCGGITPAYAGKRSAPFSRIDGGKDHPRVCGEKIAGAIAETSKYRITPAYAGKSKRSGQLSRRQKDHPRVCGEKRSASLKGYHLRGKDAGEALRVGGVGITPAYAGKRRPSSAMTAS